MLAAAAVAGFALVWIGGSGAASTGLYTSTLDVTAYKNGHGVEAGIEVAGDGAQAVYGAAVSTAPFGRYRAGLSRAGDGPITQSLDLSHTETSTNYKLALKRAGDAAWRWKAGITSQHAFSAGGGGGGDPSGAGDDALVLTADLGAREGNVNSATGNEVASVKKASATVSVKRGRATRMAKAGTVAVAAGARVGALKMAHRARIANFLTMMTTHRLATNRSPSMDTSTCAMRDTVLFG